MTLCSVAAFLSVFGLWAVQEAGLIVRLDFLIQIVWLVTRLTERSSVVDLEARDVAVNLMDVACHQRRF